MSKHTPGPWEVEAPSSESLENFRPWVGQVSGYKYAALSCGGTREEAEANARLIAAAPELLEALEDLVSNGIGTESVKRARAAIAKATGGTP